MVGDDLFARVTRVMVDIADVAERLAETEDRLADTLERLADVGAPEDRDRRRTMARDARAFAEHERNAARRWREQRDGPTPPAEGPYPLPTEGHGRPG